MKTVKSKLRKIVDVFSIIIIVIFLSNCNVEDVDNNQIISDPPIIPQNGYDWPNKQRDYWPTNGWRCQAMENHNIDPRKMSIADDYAKNDPWARALLVIKNGYIVYEKYYGRGSRESSTHLWSITKSFISTLIGIAIDKGYINSIDQLMTDYMPQYPKFNNIKIKHVLTQTTGLNWKEEGDSWGRWIYSSDWNLNALNRGQANEPGEAFLYSSANSHFLSGLIFESTGKTVGEFAQENLFIPLGIKYNRLMETIIYSSWDEYKENLPNSWRQDPMGLEIGGFGLYLTARDMAKLGFLFLNKGQWNGKRIVSTEWVEEATRDHITSPHYGYQWWIHSYKEHPSFNASGFGGQLISIVPSLDLVVVIKSEEIDTQDPAEGTNHYDWHLFDLVVEAAL